MVPRGPRHLSSGSVHLLGPRLTEHLRGNLHEAIELYHQSLSLKPDDTFTCEMLTEALKDALEEPADPTALDDHLSPPPGAKGSMGGSSSAEMMDVEPARR